ncbi:DUF368 domain-containing protein [Candidatus Woesearchaeota archaeon]|nr:DUF368 domain-containing protein [Candidatus Woesearchaeota archaeon]
MGICDIIPGISGGTIAFITGIYTRLINAVKSFSPKLVGDLFRYSIKRDKQGLSALKQDVKKLDLIFLITLGAGIATALLIGSRIITYLLENHYAYTISFFIGLILASSKAIFDHIERHHTKNIMFGLLGLLVGISLSILIPATITPNIAYIFIGGFLAISAMFLPGISGAFILLILGIYEFMLSVLHDILGKLDYFMAFTIGAILGAFSISRAVSFLFRKDKCKTLYVLLGLVIGCLSIPIKKVCQNTTSWTISNIVVMLLFLALGILSTTIVTKKSK